MSCIKAVLVGIMFTWALHCHHHFITSVKGGKTPAAPDYFGEVAINCGSVGDSAALDGREWLGEGASPSVFMSGKSRSSAAAYSSFHGAGSIPYKTSRISATEFSYTFPVNPGQKFIRLHFHPAAYRGFEKSIDYFSVKAGPFTLLRDYSAKLAADNLGVKYIVKEFCLNVEENQQLKITFSPSQNRKPKKKVYAFVNGIEIISMPTGLYYTSENELGARIVGLSNRFFIIDNSTALELIHRFNIGGSSIPPVEDFGMFRRWEEDAKYLIEPRALRVNHPALMIKYTNMEAFVVPPKIYQTSWKLGRNREANQMFNFAWKIPVELGFGYLVRLHFCELDYKMAERPREFSVLIDNQITETKADVIRWNGDIGIPVYRDYVVMMKGNREGSKSSILIGLQSVDDLILGLVNGLEIFKLSNLENSLAASKVGFPSRVSTFWNPRIENMFLVFGQSNAIGTAMTAIVILVSVVTYNLRKIREENLHEEKYAESVRVESSCRCFSLAVIMIATENFNDAFVIGRGGFGKVYKGLIPGVAGVVAIKRLNFNSKQGAYEFWAEVDTLSRLRHVHLVSLIGYCNEFQEMILVYEYMSSGTLADNLYKFAGDKKDFAPLSWEQRLRICIGAAHGLEYLHTGSEYGGVIHRDVKDTNIMLDENFVAKISDFGLSKLESKNHSKSYTITQVKGTFGYLDPDYFRTNKLTSKSDVFAFGVVMLVVLSGRPAVDTRIPGEPESLRLRFQNCMAEGDVSKILDPDLHGQISSNRLREFVKVVENCLHHLPRRRPTMAQVVESLEQALEQHRSPVSSASQLATVVRHPHVQLIHHETLTVRKNLLSAPKEGLTSENTRNLASMAEVKDRQSRGKDYVQLQKPFLVRSWKAVFNIGNKRKAEQSLYKDLPLYGYETLADATHNFDRGKKIRFFSFASIYKGILSNGQEIVVKRRSSSCHQENMEYWNEVVVISKLQHHNLVRPLGWCVERREKMLIFEYLPCGTTLDALLFDPKERPLLNWKRRKIIIEGIARGLLYLHRDSRNKIIHRDLRSSNILLDRELNPKISGFHGARIYRSNQDRTNRAAAGTPPEMALEYLMDELVSEKSDVYSYGALLLEIISGKRCSNGGIDTDYLGLVGWARKLWSENETIKLVDPAILRPGNEREILRFVNVGLLCVQESAVDVPDISTLVSMLKNDTVELPRPKLQDEASS